MEQHLTTVDLRLTIKEDLELFVMMDLIQLMVTWPVINWDSQEYHRLDREHITERGEAIFGWRVLGANQMMFIWQTVPIVGGESKIVTMVKI